MGKDCWSVFRQITLHHSQWLRWDEGGGGSGGDDGDGGKLEVSRRTGIKEINRNKLDFMSGQYP